MQGAGHSVGKVIGAGEKEVMPGIRGWTEPRVHACSGDAVAASSGPPKKFCLDVCKPLLRLSPRSPQVPRYTEWNQKSTELLLHLPLPSPHAPLLEPARRPPGLGT